MTNEKCQTKIKNEEKSGNEKGNKKVIILKGNTSYKGNENNS